MADQYGNPTIGELVGLASGFANMNKAAQDREVNDLRKRIYEEELELAEATRPFHMAAMDAETQLKKIQTDTARYEQARQKAVDGYAKWRGLMETGNQEQATDQAIDFYNNNVFDGVQAKRGEKGIVLVDAKGNEREWTAKPEDIDTAWQGYIAKDPKQFYKERKDEELQRFNFNYAATLNRKVYMDGGGNLAWWTDGVDIKTGKAKGLGVDAAGRQFTDPAELQKKGYQFLGDLDALAKDPERAKKYLDARDALEMGHLEKRLFRSKQLIEAERDPQKKAPMIDEYVKGLQRLQFYETRAGKSGALTPKEAAAVDSYVMKVWSSMDNAQMAQYDSFETFAAEVKPSLMQQVQAEKKAALVSGFLSLAAAAGTGVSPAAADAGKPDSWRNYLVSDKAAPGKKEADVSPAHTPKTTNPSLSDVVKRNTLHQPGW